MRQHVSACSSVQHPQELDWQLCCLQWRLLPTKTATLSQRHAVKSSRVASRIYAVENVVQYQGAICDLG